MGNIAYYQAELVYFITSNDSETLSALVANHRFDLNTEQRNAWQQQIQILKKTLNSFSKGQIYFEFLIPRMGKRADVVLLMNGVVFVIEFKVGASSVDRSAIDQVHDYSLDLKNFHRGSHDLPIVPIAIATNATEQSSPTLSWANDKVAKPMSGCPNCLPEIINMTLRQQLSLDVDHVRWSTSGYAPTPTIIEAAQALYRNHDVKEISRSDSGAANLGRTSDRINEIIEQAKISGTKSICFVTGVPGAGKTLAGLNIATNRARSHFDEHAVFLSGNGPLVDVMREALARDQSEREGISKKDASRRVSSFVQNIHHYRDEALRDTKAPIERVVIYDEAQRAWNKAQASKFMKQKRGHSDFEMSEPSFLVSVMDRHKDWCVVICLIGGGQEINTGEAGLAEWIKVMGSEFEHWHVHVSSRLDDPDYIWDEATSDALKSVVSVKEDALHLGVSMRSFRAESLSEFVGHVIENRPEQARTTYQKIAGRYPIAICRDIENMRKWLRRKARGSERYGLIASSGANRLRPEGVFMKAGVDAPVWFLNDSADVRSSFYLEEVASEFEVQGLELDWSGVCWDSDFRYELGEWKHYAFRGTKWQRTNADDRRLFLKNAYRVILTRARQGMIIFVPRGNTDDPTRLPSFYDPTYHYLRDCGLPEYLGDE